MASINKKRIKIMKATAPLQNENGIALIVALMLLVLLTLLGMAATTTAVLEIQIAGNDKVYKQNFYMAEAAAYEAAYEMAAEDNPTAELQGGGADKGFWLKDKGNTIDYTDLNNWKPEVNARIAVNSEAAFAAKYIKKYNAVMTDTYSMRLFKIYGHSKSEGGHSLVEIGLKLTYENKKGTG
jgi:Tfp pilus assembly protein PilX